MTEQPRHSVSVAAVIVNEDGRALCIQRRDNGHWEPPGGVLELGETIHEGLIREVREETGLTVAPGVLTGVYQNHPRNILCLVFLARIEKGAVRTSTETKAFEWLSSPEVKSRMVPAYAIRVLDAVDGCNGPAIRLHDGHNLIP